MRWGVPDEITANNKTVELCLNEIKNCRANSIGPCFIVIPPELILDHMILIMYFND